MTQADPTSSPPDRPPHTSRADRGRVIGFGVLSAIIIAVALWMQFEGRAAVSAHPSATVPQLQASRFDGNPWQLPSEPLLGFVLVPEGPFKMGSDSGIDRAAYSNERWSTNSAQGEVELARFYISRYEVTVAQFAAFVRSTQRKVDTQTLRGQPDLPVTHVTWSDAVEYGRWLASELRRSDAAPDELRALLDAGWQITLPNEAQWEKAARGAEGRVFPWGNEPDPTKANYGRSGAAPVGSFACAACANGLADMSGNVWELTRSPFQPYPWKPGDEPHDVRADALFVMRGGAFNDPPNNARAATRGGIDPGARRPFIGFRLVLEKS